MERTDMEIAQLLLAIAHHRQHDPKAVERSLKGYRLTDDEIARGTAYLDSGRPIVGR